MSRARRRRSRRTSSPDPLQGEPRLDLHMHSTRSDGRHPPLEVLETCAKRGLHTVAITDHDVPPGLPSGPHTFGRRTIRLVHAAEVSAVYDGFEFHLLAYFSGEMPHAFRAFLTERAQARAQRYDASAAALGLPPADAAAHAGQRALTRHHLAQALVEQGHCGSVHAAFQGPLARGRGVVPGISLTVAEALATMNACGAVAVWAHPRVEHARRYAETFRDLGLHGLEALRPSASHDRRAVLSQLAHQLGLVVTGGSDWHGWHGRLGSFRVRSREIAPFLARLDAPGPAAQDPGTLGVDPPHPEAVDHS